MRERALTIITLVALVASSCRCGGKSKRPPAGPREIELVTQALTRRDYDAVMDELEKNPAAGLRAVEERTAPPGSVERVLLGAMADHLRRPDDHRRWRAILREARHESQPTFGGSYDPVPSLAGRDRVEFWIERLLVSDAWWPAIAALSEAGGERAMAALRAYAAEGGESYSAFMGLAKHGRGRDIAEALAAHEDLTRPQSGLEQRRGPARVALASMTPAQQRATERELLDALEQTPLSDAQRRGYLSALVAVATPDSMSRLAALRRSDWGKTLEAQIDEVLAAAATRAPDGKSP